MLKIPLLVANTETDSDLYDVADLLGTQAVLDAATEFASAGPYPILTARGLTPQQIAYFKSAITMQAGPRAETEPNWRAEVESHGYVLP